MDEVNVAAVLQLVSEGRTLQKASLAVKRPYTCLHQFFHSRPDLEARYAAARKAWADRTMDEALEIADKAPLSKEGVAKARLRVDVRQVQAKAYNRERWGETLTVKKDVTVGVDATLLGRADDLLRLAGEKVVNEVPAELPEKVAS